MFVFFHIRNKPKRESIRSTKLHILKASVVGFGGRSAGEYRVQLPRALYAECRGMTNLQPKGEW